MKPRAKMSTGQKVGASIIWTAIIGAAMLIYVASKTPHDAQPQAPATSAEDADQYPGVTFLTPEQFTAYQREREAAAQEQAAHPPQPSTKDGWIEREYQRLWAASTVWREAMNAKALAEQRAKWRAAGDSPGMQAAEEDLWTALLDRHERDAMRKLAAEHWEAAHKDGQS